MVALALPVMLGLAGLALDLGNLFLNQTRLQAAVDAGALAGSLRLPYDKDMDKKGPGSVDQVVHDIFTAGLRNNRNDADKDPAKDAMQGAKIIKIYPGSETRSVCVDASAAVNTSLLRVLGLSSNPVSATACAGFDNLEVVLVIDSTGSMDGAPLDNVKAAAKDLVDLLLPDKAAPAGKVSLVPFRGKVHIPGGVDGLEEGCRNADGTLNKWDFDGNKMKSVSKPVSCFDIPTTLALSFDKKTIKESITKLQGTGNLCGTIISEGIKWGRNVLTPEPPFTEGGDPKKYRKVMILLTDGDTEDAKCGQPYAKPWNQANTYWQNAYYGMQLSKYPNKKDDFVFIEEKNDFHCEDGGKLNKAMLEEADATKKAGIEIFTIRFGDSDATDKSLMQQVASSKSGTTDHYYDAPTEKDIQDIFKEISRQLGWRLLK